MLSLRFLSPSPREASSGLAKCFVFTLVLLFSAKSWALAPTAIDDHVQIQSSGDLINVLGNDTGNIEPTTVQVVTPASNGFAATVPNPGLEGFIAYLPSTDFCGTDSFSYTVGDGIGNTSNEASVRVDVICREATVLEEITVQETDKGVTSGNLLISFTSPVANPAGIELMISSSDGTATTSDNDYVPLAISVNAPQGASSVLVPFEIVGDTLVENSEFFILTVSSSDITFSNAEARIVIRNDDFPPDGNAYNPMISDQFGNTTPLIDNNRFTIIHFCAIWCGACIEFTQNTLPGLLAELDGTIGAGAYQLMEVVIQGVTGNPSVAADAALWAANFFGDSQQAVGHMNADVLLEYDLSTFYELTALPKVIVVDPNGVIISSGVSFDPADLSLPSVSRVPTVSPAMLIVFAGIFTAIGYWRRLV